MPVLSSAPAHAAQNPWPHTAIGGFSTPDGHGYWIIYADGSVSAAGTAKSYGDASNLHLNGPITGGTSTPSGKGYWLVGTDGGIFGYGDAHFHGSMGGAHLNAPVFGLAATRTGQGYWLVARDGGIFGFGDAHFYGSAGGIKLNQHIVGLTTSPSGHGYRLVAGDGGIFGYGDVPFYGSLPGRGTHVTDVMSMAPTPTNRGYWIAAADGHVSAFGDAHNFGDYLPAEGDMVTGIFSNPKSPGYRLITAEGSTIPFGLAPGGTGVTTTQPWYHSQTTCVPSLTTADAYQTALNTRGPVFDGGDGGTTLDLGDGRQLWLYGDTFSGPADAVQVLPGWKMVRNSIAVETGNCMEYRVGGTTVAYSLLGAAPTPGPRWVWPASGVVDRAGGVVDILAEHVQVPVINGVQQRGYQVTGYDLLTLDLHTLAQRSATPLPTPGGLWWGAASYQSGSYVYLYAHGPTGTIFTGPPPTLYVARTTLANLASGHWTFFTGSGWSSKVGARRAISFQTDVGGLDYPGSADITITHYGSGYLASATRCNMLCNDVTAWYSHNLTGPFKAVNANAGRIGTETGLPDQYVYGGHLVTTRAGLLAAWSRNGHGSEDTGHTKYDFGVRLAVPVDLPSAAVLAGRP